MWGLRLNACAQTLGTRETYTIYENYIGFVVKLPMLFLFLRFFRKTFFPSL